MLGSGGVPSSGTGTAARRFLNSSHTSPPSPAAHTTTSTSILGTEARIDIDATWYAPTSFRLLDSDDKVIESYMSDVPGRGMQFQVDEIESLVAAGKLGGDILPPEESVAIMQTLDTIRAQIGLRYPGE